MGDQAEQARDKEDQMVEHVRDVLHRAGHVTCTGLSRAEYTVDFDGAPIVLCGCFEVFSVDESPAKSERELDARAPIDDGPPWYVEGTATEVAARPAEQETAVHALDRLARQLDHIDPTKVYTPELLEQNILDVVRRVDTGTLYEAELVGHAYHTAHRYELAFAKAMGRSEGGAAKDRQAAALVACEVEYTAMVEAEMLKKVVSSAMHNLRSSLSGYQSVLRSIGASYQAGGSPGPAGRRN